MKRPNRRTAALAGAAVLGLSGVLVLGLGLTGQAGGPGPIPLTPAAPTSAAADASAPDGEPAVSSPPSAALATPASDKHIRVPSLGVDLPLLPLTPRRAVIDPPTLTAAYWIEPFGAPVGSADQAEDTLVIAAHSDGSGVNGFDPLLSPDHGAGAVDAGDVIEVETPTGTVNYTVERTQRYAKDQLESAAEVWEAHPGRLVLITCFQRSDGRATTENFVVFAQS